MTVGQVCCTGYDYAGDHILESQRNGAIRSWVMRTYDLGMGNLKDLSEFNRVYCFINPLYCSRALPQDLR